MKKPILEVIRFDEADIVITSGLSLGMTMRNFGDRVPNNGEFTFFGRSSVDEWHDAHEKDIVSAFNSYFGGKWEDLHGVALNFAGGGDMLGRLVEWDAIVDDLLDDSKFNRTYTYENGSFTMRSN